MAPSRTPSFRLNGPSRHAGRRSHLQFRALKLHLAERSSDSCSTCAHRRPFIIRRGVRGPSSALRDGDVRLPPRRGPAGPRSAPSSVVAPHAPRTDGKRPSWSAAEARACLISGSRRRGNGSGSANVSLHHHRAESSLTRRLGE